MKNKPFVIGITGAFGSGKTTSAEFFVLNGFERVALSSFLEDEAKKRGVVRITRKILQDIGNEWRDMYGKGFLAGKAIEHLQEKKIARAVIDGIRNVGEIEQLQKHGQFILLGIVSNKKNRFERLQQVKRREELTWEVFEQLDNRDAGIGEKDTGLQVQQCIERAHIYIDNNFSLEDFQKELEKVLHSLL